MQVRAYEFLLRIAYIQVGAVFLGTDGSAETGLSARVEAMAARAPVDLGTGYMTAQSDYGLFPCNR